MQDWLFARAQATPHKIALITHPAPDVHNHLTYTQLNQQVNAMAARWQDAGIQRGDHVAMIMHTSPLAVVQIFTALRLGAVLVPINTRLTLDETSTQLTNVDCRWLLPYGTADTLQGLRERGHQIANIERAKDTGASTVMPMLDLDAPYLIVHTSGTSGTPKGAILTAGNIFYSAMSSAYRLGVLPHDKWLCTLPLFHVGGISIILRACLYGITVDLHERFDMETVNTALCEDDITLVSLVPTMLHRLLQQGHPQHWSKLRCVLLGGAAATVDLLQQCAEYGVSIAPTYGLSEAASQVATATPDVAAHKPGTVGKPLLFTQVRIINAAAQDQPPGEYGEVIVSGPTVMHGYYNNAEATARTLQIHAGQTWLHTGDIGYLNEDGDLFLVQRRSDLIISGGENIYPAEVEAALRAHPAIHAVAVVGISDAEWGHRVAAAIELEPGETLSEAALIAFSRQHLAGYKQPRRLVFVETLPRTESGKIKRQAVVALFEGQV